MRVLLCCFMMFWATLVGLPAFAQDMRKAVLDIFARAESNRDIARIKFEIDRLIEPGIDVDAQLARVDQMVAGLEAMLPPNATSWQKVETLQRFIYQPGPWNQNRPFAYDMEDPLGQAIKNKLMSDYFEDRRGNCVTMPFLFIMLGQRIGLDVWPALAPLHILVKFTDDQGRVHNLETTSGAARARDSHYNQLGPITPQAKANGVYLKGLGNRETVAVLATVVFEALLQQGRYNEAIAVGDVLMQNHPEYAYVLVKLGSAYYNLLRTEFIERYPSSAAVPQHLHARYRFLSAQNQAAFRQAEAMGWRE